MKISHQFTKTSKTAPADETSRSAQLLIRAGYIYKEMAGVYDYLPLGFRVTNKIMEIIREEMNAIGGQELTMSALQNKAVWEASGRWDEKVVDVWFKTKLSAGGELGLGFTHEEAITHMMKNYINSYKDLPCDVYQFQNKFRNELRSKSGIMRTREFIMKDLYSFDVDKEHQQKYYEEVAAAYTRIFNRLGIGEYTHRTFASGGCFCKFSDEFQAICDAGEDIIYLDPKSGIALNEEVYNEETVKDLGLEGAEFEQHKAAEVGNIFTLGTRFSEAHDLYFTNEKGERELVFMGSYGIGIGRVMGVIAELLSDDKGLVWPENIAPYKYYMVAIGDEAKKKCEELHAKASEDILYDDRENARIGEKFADADLMGIPYRVVISDKTLKNDQVEISNRRTGETELLTLDDFAHKLF